MNLFILGGTGATGRQLVQQGLEAGHQLTVLARKPSKIKIKHPNLRVVPGNVLNKTDLERAIIGTDAVLSALGHKRFIIRTSILSRGTQNLAEAMKANGIGRLICITSLGINDSRFRLGLYYTLFTIPFILYFYFRDKSKQENIIRASGLEWTIVRPGQLTNGNKRGIYKHGPGLGNYILTKMISRADVAHFMLQELHLKRYVRAAAGITY